MRFDRESWRRLYRQEPLDQRAWPLVTRAIRDHLVRYPDELDGYLLRVGGHAGDNRGDMSGDMSDETTRAVIDALCLALGAHPDERPFVERGLRTLLGDRYLVCEAGVVSIRNFGAAQQSKEARKKAKQRAKRRGDNEGTQPGHGGGQDRDTVGDNQGDKPRGRDAGARTRGDETRRDETFVRSSKRWRRIPSDWKPNDAHRALAAELGVNLEREESLIRDHEYDKPKSDPDACFRTWLNNAAEFARRRGQLPLTGASNSQVTMGADDLDSVLNPQARRA